jgi:hypothetical protein
MVTINILFLSFTKVLQSKKYQFLTRLMLKVIITYLIVEFVVLASKTQEFHLIQVSVNNWFLQVILYYIMRVKYQYLHI